MSFRLASRIRANYIFLNLISLIIFLFLQKNIVTVLLFTLWMNMMIFAYNKLNERIVLFMFLVAFFVFLLGREFLEVFFSYKTENFSEEIFIHTNKVLICSLLTLFLSYFFLEGFIFSKSFGAKRGRDLFAESLSDVTKKAFFVFIAMAMVYTLIEIYFVANNGYYAYYTHFKERLSQNIFLLLFSKAELFLNVSLCCFLATFPKKKEVDKLSAAYFIYIFIDIFTGARSSFVLGIQFLFIYYAYRHFLDPSEKFLSKGKVLLILLAIPVLLLGLATVEYLRAGDSMQAGGPFSALLDFVYDQGVSINVIKRSYQYRNLLRGDRLYSLFFLHTGVFSFFFSRGFIGNSLQNGIDGYNLTHVLSYILLGDFYLSGRGIGTSYIAELFHDFGMKGVIIGNMLLSYVLCAARRFLYGNILSRIVKLLIIQSILWMPRGNMGEILSLLFSPFTLISILIFISLAKINLKNYQDNYLGEHP